MSPTVRFIDSDQLERESEGEPVGKIEPPLVEGEWVVAERVESFGDGKKTTRIEGVARKTYWPTLIQIGTAAPIYTADWTILERRPPKPDWADADAILVKWESGHSVAYVKQVTGEYGNTTIGAWLEMLREGNPVSIRGLYLRDKS